MNLASDWEITVYVHVYVYTYILTKDSDEVSSDDAICEGGRTEGYSEGQSVHLSGSVE